MSDIQTIVQFEVPCEDRTEPGQTPLDPICLGVSIDDIKKEIGP